MKLNLNIHSIADCRQASIGGWRQLCIRPLPLDAARFVYKNFRLAATEQHIGSAVHLSICLSLSLAVINKGLLNKLMLAAVKSKFSWLRLAFDCCLHAPTIATWCRLCLVVDVCVCVSRLVSLDLSAAVSRCSHCRAGGLEALLTDLKSSVIRAIELWLKQ